MLSIFECAAVFFAKLCQCITESFVRSVRFSCTVCFCSAVSLNSKLKGFPLHAHTFDALNFDAGMAWRMANVCVCVCVKSECECVCVIKVHSYCYLFFHSLRPVILDARSTAHAEWVVLTINSKYFHSLMMRMFGCGDTDTLMVSNGYDDLWCSFSMRCLSTICGWSERETFIQSFILSCLMLIPDLDWGYTL